MGLGSPKSLILFTDFPDSKDAFKDELLIFNNLITFSIPQSKGTGACIDKDTYMACIYKSGTFGILCF